VLIADIHEDGRHLFPGTGAASETGVGAARGTKLNIPLAPGATDVEFHEAWSRIEEFLRSARPDFLLFQCGADSVAGDPITHMQFTAQAHEYAASRLCLIADELGHGRVVGTGGGGYNRRNLAVAWAGVVKAFVAASRESPHRS